MTHLRLAEPSMPPKPPRAMRRVRGLLADLLKSAETRRYVECVVVTLDQDGGVSVGNTTGDPTRLLGMLEIARQDILSVEYALDVE